MSKSSQYKIKKLDGAFYIVEYLDGEPVCISHRYWGSEPDAARNMDYTPVCCSLTSEQQEQLNDTR